MDKREFICIGCPVGCMLSVEVKADEILVTGNECNIGKKYAEKEVSNPRRNISLALETKINDQIKMIAVKTKGDIPKDKIFDCVKEIKKLNINFPVKTGDVLIRNILDTGSDIVAVSGNI